MSVSLETAGRFKALFGGLEEAFGTGDSPGRWVKRPPQLSDFTAHLAGQTSGIGIAPLRPDNTVLFAAIDHDVVGDFETGLRMQHYIPGASWLERTRNGKVHVWVFFSAPCPAWVAMGVLREVCVACDVPQTEVFPKNHDFARVKLGNYINLPYHGSDRPILAALDSGLTPMSVEQFIHYAEATRNDPRKWEQRADLLLLKDPAQRSDKEAAVFGTQDNLHMCAEYIIANAVDNPLREGHQSNTMFLLAKQLSNWRMCDHDEALAFMMEVNEHAEPGIPESEVRRILRNAEEKQYTSLGCDDPVVAPYVHPDCPIAHPRRSR